MLYLLLQRHPETTHAGDIWQTVVGSVRWDEERVQAARREVFEETGLTMLRGITAIGYAFSFPIRLPKNQKSWYAPGRDDDQQYGLCRRGGRRAGRSCSRRSTRPMAGFLLRRRLDKLHWPEEKEALSRLHPLIASAGAGSGAA